MRSVLNLSYGPYEHQKLDIHLPEAGMPVRAAFVYFHGGGLEMGVRQIKGAAHLLPDSGIALITASYCLYPNARWPEFIEDSALAVAWVKSHLHEYAACDTLFVGGSSAGAYLAMMLFFDPRYLGRHGIAPSSLAGFVFNAGQPTTHFNVLRERGLCPSLIRVDEAAPMYFVDETLRQRSVPLLFMLAENDMPCRREQTDMLLTAMRMLDYPQELISMHVFSGFSHCKYDWNEDFTRRLVRFMEKNS